MQLDVSSVHVGSFHTHATVAYFDKSAFYLTVPAAKESPESPARIVDIRVEIADLTGIWVFWGSADRDAVFFLHTAPEAATRIRAALNMVRLEPLADENPYFCPTSNGDY